MNTKFPIDFSEFWLRSLRSDLVILGGIISSINFSGKPLIGGQKNICDAKVYRSTNPDDVLFTIKGQWSDSFTISDVREGEDIEIVDMNAVSLLPIRVLPLDQQDPWESQRVWADVVQALENHNMPGTSEATGALEQAQREMRAREDQGGREWESLFFKAEEGDGRFEDLAKGWPKSLEQGKTKGVWRFDEDAVRHGKTNPAPTTQTDPINESPVDGGSEEKEKRILEAVLRDKYATTFSST